MVLSVGTRLGPYDIVAPLGAGGMGEVYRARDPRLKRDVAIKVLPETFATDPDRLERFQREAELLATLNHPNIAAVYGLEESGHITAIVLELVEGETLADRLARGAIPMADALSIARQITDAMDAAQEQGIVHRDLKPANIKITPRGVVKVLDFGLAKAVAADRSSPDLTHSPTMTAIRTTDGVVLGTAAYMSPEQARGKPVDKQTDIWAFGCVLYEMLTGRRAFAGNTAMDSIAAILERQPNWDALPSALPASVERLIHRCLEKERDQRVGDIAELRAGLDPLAAGTAQTRGLTDRWPYAVSVAGAAVLVGLLLLTNARGWRDRLSLMTASRNPPPAVNLAQTKPRRAIAVMGFKNLSGRKEAAWLSPALSETLTMELGTGGTLRAIPGESITRMKIDLAFADIDSFAQDTLTQIRRNIGADVLILGSYLTVGKEGEGQIRLDVRLQDAATGDVVATITETGSEPELLELVSRTGAHLREKLGVGALSEEESAQARASLPSSGDIVRLYSEGLDKLRLFDALLARDLLQKAVSADPNYALAHSALASAWSTLGYDVTAIAEAKKALDLSGRLAREQRLAIEGSYREMVHEWSDAAKIYRALWTVFPDNLEYGLRLVEVFAAGGMGKDGLAVVDQLRMLPAPAKDDPRIDLAEGAAAGSLSDFKRQQVAAERAATKGRAQGTRLLLARARLLESRALYEQGQLTQAAAASQEAKDLYTAAGDRAGAAAALNNIATVLSDRGDVIKATEMYEQAVEIFRQIGNKKGMANALNNIAVRLKDRGDLPGARKVQERVLALRREIGDKSGAAVSLNNVGVIFFEQGNLASAKRMYQDSLSICSEIGDKRGAVRAMLNMAIVLTHEGDLAGGKRLHEKSLAIRREIGDRRGVAVAQINLADVLFSQGDLASATSAVDESMAIGRETDSKRIQAYALSARGGILEAEGHLEEARKAHLDALAIREQLRETLTIVESRIRLAALAIEEGKAAEAEALARSAAQESQRSKQAANERGARAVLARALFAQNKLDEARNEIAQSSALLGKSENREARLGLRIIEGRVAAASGQTAAAAKAIEATRQEAAKAGLIGLELEARLALGEVEMRSANGTSGRARLELLQKEASAKGFGLIARKSAAAMRLPP